MVSDLDCNILNRLNLVNFIVLLNNFELLLILLVEVFFLFFILVRLLFICVGKVIWVIFNVFDFELFYLY